MGKIKKLIFYLQKILLGILCAGILSPNAYALSPKQAIDKGKFWQQETILFSLLKKNARSKIDISSVLVEDAVMPENVPGLDINAPGILAQWGENAVIDYSNTSDGYVMVMYAGYAEEKIKAQVESAGVTYTYTLSPNVWTAFPLSEGNGQYTVTILEGLGDSRYALLMCASFYAEIRDEFAPFLRSNQYVNYATAPNSVATAANLVSQAGDTLETVRNIYSFVISYLKYDMQLAETVTSGYVPDLDAVLVKRSGICFDYASLMTGMLRSLQIPCKLVVGYADDLYHAWISVWVEGEGWIDNVIHFNGREWQFMDPTFASSGYKGETSYSAKYFY